MFCGEVTFTFSIMRRRVFMALPPGPPGQCPAKRAILPLIAKSVEIRMPFSNNQRTNGGSMRTGLPLAIFLSLALCAAAAIHAQSGNSITSNPITSNPIPAPITKRGLTVEIRDVVRLPDTRGLRPADQDVVPAGWARINYLRDLPDGRRFAHDPRGFAYLLDRNNQPSGYANVGA